jgi:ElaB/YqjD/DUF883 family membrane-anchored ribosome-binding protein
MSKKNDDSTDKVRPIDRARELYEESGVAERLDEARQRVSSVAEQAQERLGSMADEAQHKAEEFGDSARARIDDTTQAVRRGYHKARGDLRGALDDVSEWVRENPAPAIGIAAGIGFAFGLLLRSRREGFDDE